MSMRLLPRAKALSEFIGGLTGDCGQTAELCAVHVITGLELNATDLLTIVHRDVQHGWAGANGAEPIGSIYNDLVEIIHLPAVNYGYSEPPSFNWEILLEDYGGVQPLIFEFARAGQLPGDEAAVQYHFICCVGWDSVAKVGLFADGDNPASKQGLLVQYALADLTRARVCALVRVTAAIQGVPVSGQPTGFYGLETTTDATVWYCASTGKHLGGGFRDHYAHVEVADDTGDNATAILGLPISDEYAQSDGTTRQDFERGSLIADTKHVETKSWTIFWAPVGRELQAANARATTLGQQLTAANAAASTASQKAEGLQQQLDAATKAAATIDPQAALDALVKAGVLGEAFASKVLAPLLPVTA